MLQKKHNWTADDTILAFELYCRIPKSQDRETNPKIIALAQMIGTTAKSVKAKLQNFKSYDPSYTKDGKKGLSHGSKLDKEIAYKFMEDWQGLLYQANIIKQRLQLTADYKKSPDIENQFAQIPSGSEKLSEQKQRIGAGFFRAALLASYRGQCCITGIKTAPLLRASHIKPWKAANANEKTDPRNGLLLNALFDAAFDKGYISIDRNYKLLISPQIQNGDDKITQNVFAPYQGKQIHKPDRFCPDKIFLEYHNDAVFLK